MIDTIHFRIHDLRRHAPLVRKLHQKGHRGSSKFVKDIPSEDVPKKVYNSRYWRDWSTGREVEEAYRDHLPSWHYDVAYSINFARDFIDFNVSIPKYLYRTNVFQFVPHYFDDDFSLVYGNKISERGKASYDRLLRWLNTFCETKLDGLVDWQCVQIARIDLCFNKLFDSKEAALDYMKDLKKIKKKHSRESKVFTDGNYFGLYYVHDDYTFKIYHKGSEFKVHDRSELKKQGVSSDKIEVIQDFADRMVRYEVEFRTGMMDRIWKRKSFRPTSIKWKKARRYYFQYSRGNCIIKNGVKLYRTPPLENKETGEVYSRKQREEMTMSLEQFALVKYGEFFTNKTFHFYLKSDSKIKEDSVFWDAEIKTRSFTYEQEQKFSRSLFHGLVDQFLVFYREFSVQYQEDIRYVIKRIEETKDKEQHQSIDFYNHLKGKTDLDDKVLRRISKSKFKAFLKLLETKSFSEIKELGWFKERTFYLYKKVFVELGFGELAPSKLVSKGDDTFTDYLYWVDQLSTKLYFDNLFKSKF
jgi:hypothetical protein